MNLPLQVEFLKLVAAGDHVAALKVASAHLGPLAASNQALLKPLKETLVTLIQLNEDVLTKAVSLPVLASSLQVYLMFICCKSIRSLTYQCNWSAFSISVVYLWY